MSKQSDIRDIILFIVGILFIVFPPAWAIRWNTFADEHEIFVNFLIAVFIAGLLIMGYLYNVWKGKR